MAGLTVSGIGSGLNISGIVDSLVSAEQSRFAPKEQQASDIKTRISAYGRVRSSLGSLQDIARKLQTTANRTTRAETSDPTLLQVNAGTGAAAANYEISVNRSAQSSRWESGSMAGGVFSGGDGLLRVTRPSDGRTFSLRVTAGMSLSSLASALNTVRDDQSSSAELQSTGTKASVINVNGQQRLILEGSSGAQSDFDVRFTPDAGMASAAFAKVQTARDAEVAIKRNGVVLQDESRAPPDTVFRSANNTFNAVPGMTNVSFSIRRAVDAPADKPATLTVLTSADQDALKTQLRELVSQVNSTLSTLKTNQKKGGQLESETTPIRLIANVRNVLGAMKEGNSLSAIGLSFNKDGVMAFDEARFSTAVEAAPSITARMLGDAGATGAGVAKELVAVLGDAMGVSGVLSTRTESLNRQTEQIDRNRVRFQDSIDKLRKRLTLQFTALDTTVANLQQSAGTIVQRLSVLQTPTGTNR